MTTSRDDRAVRFEHELRSFLDAEAGLDRPDYLTDVLLRSATMRQRPAWTFPARALPGNAAFVQRPIGLIGGPLRLVAIAALLLLLLVAIAMVVGSKPPNELTAYGLAANGRVAYASEADIWTADPVTGRGTVIVSGPSIDRDPVWSRDGMRIAFFRYDPASEDGRLFVASADGSGARAVTPPFAHIHHQAFSPDGAAIAFLGGAQGTETLWVSDVATGATRALGDGMLATELAWVPGTSEIVVAAPSTGKAGHAISIVDTTSGDVRVVVESAPGVERGVATVSPDGTRIAYAESDAADPGYNTYRIRVVEIDGSSDRLLPMPAGATFQDRPVWSNDGTRLAIVRGYAPRNTQVAIAIVPADGSGTGVETTRGVTGCCNTLLEWAPDDTVVLVQPESNAGTFIDQILVDPATGVVTPAPWTAASVPSWQRLAP